MRIETAFKSPLVLLIFCLLAPAFAESAALAQDSAEPAATARTISLDLQGVGILDVLKLLSKRSNLNIVAGKNVQGQVSIFLQNVEVMEALRTILETSDLACVKDGEIIKVITRKDYEELYGMPYSDSRITRTFGLSHIRAESLSQTLSQMKSPSGKIVVEPRTNTLIITETPGILREMENFIPQADRPAAAEVFHLKYTKAEDIEAKLREQMKERQGQFEIDKRSNRIFVTDVPEGIEKVRRLVEAFDVRQPQVLIEAKVVEVQLSERFRWGIDWKLVLDKAGSLSAIRGAAAYPVSAPAGAALTALNLGSDADDLQTVIQLIEQFGRTNTLSSPRLTVLNQEEARLAVATKEPFVSQTVVQSVNTATTADNVQFVDVGVTLKVMPVISDDAFIQLKIQPEVSTAGNPVELQGVSQGSNTAFTRTRIPVVTTQVLETTVVVKSGNTIVIGGLMQERRDQAGNRLPWLGRIPVLGKAFSSSSRDETKTELVVFLTPTLLDPELQTGETGRFLGKGGQLKI